MVGVSVKVFQGAFQDGAHSDAISGRVVVKGHRNLDQALQVFLVLGGRGAPNIL